MNDPLTQFQLDLVGRLESSAYFDDLPIIQERTGVTESELAEALGSATVKAGKFGAAVLVKMPTRAVDNPDTEGPRYSVLGLIRVLEYPLLNRVAGGTGKTAEDISLVVEGLFHLWATGDAAVFCKGAPPWNDGEGNLGYDVRLGWFLQAEEPPRCVRPEIHAAADAVQIVCTTPAAALHYTLDGSFPGLAAPLYTGPISPLPDPGTLVRAAAYADGRDGSDVASLLLTA